VNFQSLQQAAMYALHTHMSAHPPVPYYGLLCRKQKVPEKKQN